MKKTVMAIGTAVVALSAVATTYYVNPGGNDSWDGLAAAWDGAHGPMRTLAAVMADRRDGDVVLAAEGEYADRQMETIYRVVVPAGVTLKASGDRSRTAIVGAPATGVTTDAEPWGCGSDAVQCVKLGNRARLVNFTVRGGRGQGFDKSKYSAGVTGTTQSGADASLVIDCVISNCVSGRAAGLRSVTAVRCRLSGNRVCADGTGSHAFNTDAYMCAFGTSDSYNRYDAISCRLFGCHVFGSARQSELYNSYVVYDYGGNKYYASAYQLTRSTPLPDEDEDSFQSSTMAVDANMRPVAGSNEGINMGKLSVYDGVENINSEFLSQDFAGGQRVYDGAVDIGCGEYDPRATIAAALSSSEVPLEIPALSPSAVWTQASGTLSLPGGAEMSALWSETAGGGCYALTVSVSGSATLNVYLNGSETPIWTMTAADGARTLSTQADGSANFRLVVTGDGSAEITGFDRGGVYYVNPGGNDSWDGLAAVWDGAHGPMRTLAAVMEDRRDGDVVLAAEGEYADMQMGIYRVDVPAGVTLKASGDRSRTAIVGAPATGVTTDADPWGCGSDAVQCVKLGNRARLVNFTVRGGRGQGFDNSKYGAGVTGTTQNGTDASLVIDCVISNCVSGRGAGLRSATAVRCWFSGNRVNDDGTGSHTWNADAYNCVLAESDSYSRYDAYVCRLFNCHVFGSARSSEMYNSFVTDDYGLNAYTSSVYAAVRRAKEPPTADADSFQSSTMVVDSNMRPVEGLSYGIDHGKLSAYDGVANFNAELLSPDFAGGQRVYNGAIDIGCGEWSSLPMLSSAMDRSRRISVTAAGGNVVTNAAGMVTVPAGESIEFDWTSKYDGERTFRVSATEGADVVIRADGSELTPDDQGVCVFPREAGAASLVVSCGGTGAVSLSDFKGARGGILLIVR